MKKIILLILFFSISSFAEEEIRVSLEQETYQSLHQTVFYFKKSGIRRWQNSNLFGRDSDFRLGEMFLAGQIDKDEMFKKVKQALIHYQAMDARLKKENKSINDLVTALPHQRVLRVNQFIVSETDESYKGLYEMVKNLLAREAILLQGVHVFPSEDKIDHIQKQKLIRTAPFKSGSKCSLMGDENVCHVGKFGVLVLKAVK